MARADEWLQVFALEPLLFNSKEYGFDWICRRDWKVFLLVGLDQRCEHVEFIPFVRTELSRHELLNAGKRASVVCLRLKGFNVHFAAA